MSRTAAAREVVDRGIAVVTQSKEATIQTLRKSFAARFDELVADYHRHRRRSSSYSAITVAEIGGRIEAKRTQVRDVAAEILPAAEHPLVKTEITRDAGRRSEIEAAAATGERKTARLQALADRFKPKIPKGL
jgi:hypothetical protein